MKSRVAFVGAALALAFVAVGVFAADETKPLAPNTFKADAPKYTGTTVVEKKAPAIVCPISGKPINKDAAVDFEGAKVYMCCENCPGAFKRDTAKYAAKAHLQMVQTEQLKQVACPFSGHDMDPTKVIEVEGVKVAFCCENCEAKAKKAKPEELVSLVFKDTSKGFKLAKDIKKDEAKK
jgi:hypothetical protein